MRGEEVVGRMAALVDISEKRIEKTERIHEAISEDVLRLQQNAREMDDLRGVVGDLVDIVAKSRNTDWVGVGKLASILEVDEQTIRRWFREGVIPGYRITENGHIRFDLREVDQAIKARGKVTYG